MTPTVIEDIFLAALEKTNSHERAVYLDQACHGDAELRARVERLLHAHPQAGSFLQRPVADFGATLDPMPGADQGETGGAPVSPSGATMTQPAEAIGSRIGPYKLIQLLGEGGMGVVWVAEQTVPVKRRVALKVIKPGMDSAQVLRRFEAERQALAMMDHTNIAKVLDAGAVGEGARGQGSGQTGNCAGAETEHRASVLAPDPSPLAPGRPYFVMELVKGVPITRYCDELHLPLRERLELFVPVCQAIQHAHQKGIIHRDIKPSNVLVCIQDGKPVPKVIDFGVAKALHQKLAEQSMYTEIGQIVGTLEYMSPEQAELSALDIDTRADVYALGVLLYELLTGSTPLDRARLKSAALIEMLRIIKEEEPPRPSRVPLRNSDCGLRIEDRGRLRRFFNPQSAIRNPQLEELDWIVMRCLEKDRTRRYEAASGLAKDIERYLHDEAVEACPPSTAYRLKKLLRRNKGTVIATAAVFLVLLAGTAVSLWQAKQALQAREMAIQERAAAEAARQLAVEQQQEADVRRREAEQARQQAQAVSNFVMEALRRTDPALDGRQLRVVDLLDTATARLEADWAGSPTIHGELLFTLGQAYSSLGLPRKAAEVLERARRVREQALGKDHADTLLTDHALAAAYMAAGMPEQAVPVLEELLRNSRSVPGREPAQALAIMDNLAVAYQRSGQSEKAWPLLRTNRELRLKQLPASIAAGDWQRLAERGDLYARGGDWGNAAADFAAAVAAHPEEHVLWFRSASLRLQINDLEGYRQHCREMLRRFGQTSNPLIAERVAKTCLLVPDSGCDLELVGRLAELAISGTENNPWYGYLLLTRGVADYRAGQFTRAIPWLQKSISPEPEWRFLNAPAYLFLAMAHHSLGKEDEARLAMDKARAIMQQDKFPRVEWGDLGVNWHDWLICQIISREAEAALGEKARPGKEP